MTVAHIDLSTSELQRYSRHLLLPEVGISGQQRLSAARVLLIGTGGLGCPAALYLAAVGVGTIGLVDDDHVDVSNLQRQVLYRTADVGQRKVDVAAERLTSANPHIHVVRHPFRLTRDNAVALFSQYDLVVDGTDNFATRYLVNDACLLAGRPNVYGSIFRFDGQVSIFCTADGPCYRCVYPSAPPAGMVPSCAEGGVLGVLPGLIGTWQATEAIKLILGVGNILVGRMLLLDALGGTTRTVRVQRRATCAWCATKTVTTLGTYDEQCAIESPVPEITPLELRERLAHGEPCVVLDVRESHELTIAPLPHTHHVPLGQLGQRLGEIPRDASVVVVCRSGARSAKATRVLLEAGYRSVHNLAGGSLRWSDEVDDRVPKY